MTGGEIFVECLKAQGVKAIFGMPGNHLNAVYESFYKNRDTIRHYRRGHGACSRYVEEGLMLPSEGHTGAVFVGG